MQLGGRVASKKGHPPNFAKIRCVFRAGKLAYASNEKE
jgi:hypothetical protein